MVYKVIEILRNSFVHIIYEFLRYDLRFELKFMVLPNIRRRRWGKLKKYLKWRFKRCIGFDVPRRISIDIIGVCNLKCPLCSVPVDLTKKKTNWMGELSFQDIVDNLDMGIELTLGYTGEPLLHPLFSLFADSVIDDWYVSVITNGTLLHRKRTNWIVRNSLIDFLSFSFDGWSKESYEKYRVGADFDKTKANLIYLLKNKTDLPHVTVRYLISSYTEDEVGAAEKELMELGLDNFKGNPLNLGEYHGHYGSKEDFLHWLPKKSKVTYYDQNGNVKERSKKCNIFMSPVIRSDGEIMLCCVDVERTVEIGNVFDSKLSHIWNSGHYRRVRKLARKKKFGICARCMK